MRDIEELVSKLLSEELNEDGLSDEEKEMVKKYCIKESKEMKKKINTMKKENEKKSKLITKYKKACELLEKKEAI